jgi:anaerobic magnesium-protoporphyrin IX monomethyl ester cyclase
MAKVLLVNPPFYRLLGSHYNANSLGIAYVASYLNQHGHDAWLYNADYVNDIAYPSTKEIFGSFNSYLDYFSDEQNLIWLEVAEKIANSGAAWVGYTSYTANIKSIRIISDHVSRMNPRIRQVVGGVHATLDANVLASMPSVEFAVRREGEQSMLHLVNGVNPKNIIGVDWRDDPLRVIGSKTEDSPTIDDIDSLPMPERDKLYGLTDQEKMHVDVSYICSVRGCPYRCNYCASPAHWKRNKTRYRSARSVLQEMSEIKEKYWNKKMFDYSASANIDEKSRLIIPDNTSVYFVDDIFTIKKDRCLEIMHGMIDRELQMPWKCESRADHLDDEICYMLKKSGCQRVKIGFETGSDRILKKIHGRVPRRNR